MNLYLSGGKGYDLETEQQFDFETLVVKPYQNFELKGTGTIYSKCEYI